jgi:hypothetical protein
VVAERLLRKEEPLRGAPEVQLLRDDDERNANDGVPRRPPRPDRRTVDRPNFAVEGSQLELILETPHLDQ